MRVNKIKRVYRRSRVYVKVEPPGLSYIASISFTQVNFMCDRTVKFRDSGNPPKDSALSVSFYVVDKWPLTQFFFVTSGPL